MATTLEQQQQVIGERVLVLRRRARMSQQRLANKLGRGRNWPGQVERGEADVTIADLWALADALNTSPDYLLGRTDDRTPSTWTGYSTPDLRLLAAA